MSGRSVVTEGPAWALVLPEIQPASAQWSPERAEDLWLQKDEGRRRPEGEGVLLPEALGLIPGVRSAGRGGAALAPEADLAPSLGPAPK